MVMLAIMSQETAALLARMRGFLLPEGDETAHGLSTVRIFEKGEMRVSEEARWMSFTSALTFQTKFSEFRWEARTSGVVITDAYEEGHGIAMSRLAGLLTLKKASRGWERAATTASGTVCAWRTVWTYGGRSRARRSAITGAK